ncbi:hypothetical protein LSH36_246g00010 [Paralvinella palmiformis]|uniref:Uncharacterized protein n=1 Tax=Paralvinella palmiformis TaxID=53620 RepID=A0AAD9N2X2_9ANNE|nr:hypothetical protein LSH36_246g00010 [Paralvinella palmiformis]
MALKTFDPWPLDCRNDDQVRSIWLNSTATNPPIRQMYAPANVYAIANDHDYQDKSPEDKEPTSSGGKNVCCVCMHQWQSH